MTAGAGPGGGCPPTVELRRAFDLDQMGPIAPGGELTSEVYPSGSSPARSRCSYMTDELGSVAPRARRPGGERAFRCVADPLNWRRKEPMLTDPADGRRGGAVSLSAHLTAGTAEHGRLRVPPRLPALPGGAARRQPRADSLVSASPGGLLAAGWLAFSAARRRRRVRRPRRRGEPGADAGAGAAARRRAASLRPGGDETRCDTTRRRGCAALRPEAGDTEDEDVGGARWRPSRPPTAGAPPVLDPSRPLSTPAARAVEPPPATPPTGTAAGACDRPPAAPRAATGRRAGAAAPRSPSRASVESARRPSVPQAARVERRPVIGTSPTPPPESPAPVAEAAAAPARRDGGGVGLRLPRRAAAGRAARGPISGRATPCARATASGRSPGGCSARSASAGRIAREVNRLWELNRDRIGTGNPSLIHVGTVLKL